MNEDGLLVGKKGCGLLQSASRLKQQQTLVADTNQRGILGSCHMLLNLIGKVMDVHHEAVVALFTKLVDDDVKQRLASHLDQRFRHVVGERLETSAQACSENHGLLHRGAKVQQIGHPAK